MNSTGCGFLLLAFLAVVMGFVPFLVWTNYVVALPLAIISTGIFAVQARKKHVQPADRMFFWIALGFLALIVVRLVVFEA